MKKTVLLIVTLILGALLLSGCYSSSSSSSYRYTNSNYSDQQLREDFAYFEGRWDAMTGK